VDECAISIPKGEVIKQCEGGSSAGRRGVERGLRTGALFLPHGEVVPQNYPKDDS
jgi:hypothetical protein